MPTIETSDGAEIFYDIHGSGSIHLLFLHGWGCSGEIWNGVIQGLDNARFRSICVDLRGHGKSTHGNNFSWQFLADDILAVVEGPRIEKFIPIGFSMGGKLACFLAAKFPKRIPAQILVAPAAPGVVPIDREFGFRVCREAGDWRQNKRVFQSWFAPGTKNEIVNAYCQAVAQVPQIVLEA